MGIHNEVAETGLVRSCRAFLSAMLSLKEELECLSFRDPNMEADVGYPPSRDGFSGRRMEDGEEDDTPKPWLTIWRGVNRYILAGTYTSKSMLFMTHDLIVLSKCFADDD